ncbi:MAG: ankyrin repeat domain-containing protein [Alphaproteobacteria bacterium]|nr:ankyrin repeat domain-containing protein [Alphaproteobacteria bacterium]
MRLKTFCACLALVTYSGIAMDPTSDRGIQTAGERKATAENKSGPVDQTNLENLSKEELLKIIADLQQKVEKHESVLAEIVGNNVIGKALKNNRMDTISFLLDNGANLEKLQKRLRNKLKTCAIFGHVDMFKFLLEKGADPNGLDKNGNSLLITALRQRKAEIAKLLLDHDNKSTGKKLIPFTLYDTPNKNGETPLMLAVWVRDISDSDRLEIIKSLLEKGAEVNRTDRKGISALKIAREINASEEIIKLLKDAGATEDNEKDAGATEDNEKDDSKNISATNGKSPAARLFDYCQRKNLSLKFKCEENPTGKVNCVIILKGNKYDDGEYHKSEREAKNATADYTLRKLMGLDRDPIKELNDYCLDKSTSIDVSDITYIYDEYEDGTFNCKIQLKDKIFDLSLNCKSKEEAKKKIAEHVYKILTNQTESNETSRQGLFSEENYPSSYNSREAEKTERDRIDSVSSSSTSSDSESSGSSDSSSSSSTSSDYERSGSSNSRPNESYIRAIVHEHGGSSPSLSPESSTSSDSESSTSSDSESSTSSDS